MHVRFIHVVAWVSSLSLFTDEMWDPTALLHRRKQRVLSSLLFVWCCAGLEFMMSLCLSLSCPLWCWYFLICLICSGVTELVSGFLSEGIAPCVVVHLICLWEEVSSGASYVVILTQKYSKVLLMGVRRVDLWSWFNYYSMIATISLNFSAHFLIFLKILWFWITEFESKGKKLWGEGIYHCE